MDADPYRQSLIPWMLSIGPEWSCLQKNTPTVRMINVAMTVYR